MERSGSKRPRVAPAVQDAEAFICRQIDKGIFKPGGALPTLAKLAKMAGVSYVSMWKAVAGLRGRGVLETRPGQPVKVRALSTDSDTAVPLDFVPSSRAKWEIVKKQIERDIYNGTYPPGLLMPSVKQLEAGYGISYSVLRKALSSLVEEQIILPRARGYAPATFPLQRAKNRIVLLAPCNPKAEYVVGMFSEELIRSMEKECLRSDISFQITGYHHDADAVRYYDFLTGEALDIADNEQTFGYILFVSFHECGWEDALQRLVGVRKPIALIDQVGGLDQARVIMKYNQQFQIFSVSTSGKPGREVGRYLLSLGHRRIAYLSPYHKSDWSINRFRGLASVFEAAGISEGVVPITSTFANSIEVLARGIPESGIETVLEFYRQQRAKVHPSYGISLDKVLHVDEGQLRMMIHDAQVRRYSESMFRAALEDKTITAWVAANDHLSMLALEYLRCNRVECPGAISLIGFDDTRWALENRLTTYNFNIPGLLHNVFRHILDQRFRKNHSRMRAVEVDGIIIERGRCSRAAL